MNTTNCHRWNKKQAAAKWGGNVTRHLSCRSGWWWAGGRSRVWYVGSADWRWCPVSITWRDVSCPSSAQPHSQHLTPPLTAHSPRPCVWQVTVSPSLLAGLVTPPAPHLTWRQYLCGWRPRLAGVRPRWWWCEVSRWTWPASPVSLSSALLCRTERLTQRTWQCWWRARRYWAATESWLPVRGEQTRPVVTSLVITTPQSTHRQQPHTGGQALTGGRGVGNNLQILQTHCSTFPPPRPVATLSLWRQTETGARALPSSDSPTSPETSEMSEINRKDSMLRLVGRAFKNDTFQSRFLTNQQVKDPRLPGFKIRLD